MFQITGEVNYLEQARRLGELMITEFWDEENGGFFFTSNDHEELIVRNKDFYDNATPSGNSAAADVLLRLSKFYGDERYERFANTVLRLSASQMGHYPQGFGRMLSAAEFFVAPKKEVAIAAKRSCELARVVFETYLPHSIIALASEKGSKALPLLADKHADGAVYICENFICNRPATTVEEVEFQLS